MWSPDVFCTIHAVGKGEFITSCRFWAGFSAIESGFHNLNSNLHFSIAKNAFSLNWPVTSFLGWRVAEVKFLSDNLSYNMLTGHFCSAMPNINAFHSFQILHMCHQCVQMSMAHVWLIWLLCLSCLTFNFRDLWFIRNLFQVCATLFPCQCMLGQDTALLGL